VIAAGDSEFDIPMLQAADTGIAPGGFRQEYSIDFQVEEMPGKGLFSDEMTEKVLELCRCGL
ncbi:MAG: HAD family hydrolase, partial [Acetatifactor sp.]|nr:HAD family hydrolase [Acetatifactor sp.]